jgi:putative protease
MAHSAQTKKEGVMPETLVGRVTHYFGRIGVAVVKLSAPLSQGDTVHFRGKSTDFTQVLESMQIEHQPVREAKPGDEVAIKVSNRVREGDEVYKVTP